MRQAIARAALMAGALLVVSPPVHARQAVQVTGSVAQGVNERYRQQVNEWAAGEAVDYVMIADDSLRPFRESRARAIDDILEYEGDVEGLARLVERYRTVGRAGESLPGRQQVRDVPALFIVNESVVFTLGWGFGFRRGIPGSSAVGLGTNLIGAAIGGIAETLGAGGIGEYFKRNVSLGTGLPTGPGELSGSLGLGLGEVTVKSQVFWPVLSVAQFSSEDDVLPGAVLERAPDQAVWTTPTIGIGWVHDRKWLEKRLSEGKLAYVLSIGVGLPFYYPGGVGDALGALFSDSRGQYVRSGRTGWSFSAAVPLFRVKTE